LGLPDDCVVITNIGAVIKEKGCQTLTDMAVAICKANSDVVVLIVGPIVDKSLGDRLIKEINNHSLSNRIRFLGYRTDVPSILEGTDIYVCASLMETFSLSIVEAMYFGKPVISTRCGGPEEIVDDGKTGLLIPVADVEQMVSAVEKLLECPELRTEFGNNGRSKYLSKYTPRSYWQALEALYESNLSLAASNHETEKIAEALVRLLEPLEVQRCDESKGPCPPSAYTNSSDQRIEELLNSMSWRITAPLRAIYNIFSRFRS